MRSISCSLAAVVVFLILLSHVWAQQPTDQQSGTPSQYVVDTTWPRKPDHFKWGQMPGIAVDTRDKVYIFTRSQPAVQVYGVDGTFLRAWNIEDFGGAHYIRIGPEGNVWAANIKNHVVRKYSPKGKLLAVWANLITPWGLCLTKNDEIWVCGSSPVRKDGTGEWIVVPPSDQMVMKLSQKGEVLLRLPLSKTTVPPGKLGEVNWVHGIKRGA